MLIKSEIYSVLQAACGIELSFDKIQPISEKLADITSASRSNRISNLQINNLSEPISTGQYVEIRDLTQVNPNFNNIDSSFLGTYPLSAVSYATSANSASITYYQNTTDIISVGVIGEVYSINNINPRDFYSVEFRVESIVPSSAQAILRPSGYIVGGYQSFIPTTTLEIKSAFSTSAKTLIKMTIKDVSSNEILRNEYIEVVMSNSQSKPCEIISQQPIENTYVNLDMHNNWTYDHQIYTLAKFIPKTKNNNISLRLVKKNNQLLPSSGGNNKIKIVADPLKLTNKKVTIDQIRTAIVSQFNSIQNYYAVANLGNKSYDIIVKDIFLQPSDLNDLVVAVVPPETGVPVKFNEVATAETYSSDIDNVPGISLLYWNHNNSNEYLGELHFDKNIYNNDPLKILYNSSGLTGIIKDFTNGLVYLTAE
jgi:hypothetical protein